MYYESTEKDRGSLLLRILLILLVLGNLFALGVTVFMGLLLFLPFLTVNLICIWAIYNWRKWGLDIYTLMGILSFFSSLVLINQETAVICMTSYVVDIILLYLAMRPVRYRFI